MSPTKLDALRRAFIDWREGLAYVDRSGNYHTRNMRTGNGPIAPWNRVAKQAGLNATVLHYALRRYTETMTAPELEALIERSALLSKLDEVPDDTLHALYQDLRSSLTLALAGAGITTQAPDILTTLDDYVGNEWFK